jgi:hypothetical protein
MMKPRQGRHIGKMSLLTELEILGDGFLQRCRAYGAGKYPVGILGDEDSFEVKRHYL